MSDADALLEQARDVLDARTSYSHRAACWIARAALESTVDELLDARDRSSPAANMRSKLSVLQVAYASDLDVPARAEYAWDRLSDACHHHAFELSPTGSEALHLIDLVAGLSRIA